MNGLRVGLLVVVAVLLAFAGVGGGDPPGPPAGYYGTVHTDTGEAVPDGTELRITVDNETATTVTVTNGTYEVYLEADGETVGFWIEETSLTNRTMEATRTEQNLTVPESVFEPEPDDSTAEDDTEPTPAGGAQGGSEESTPETPTNESTTNETTTTPWPTDANFTATPETITTVDAEKELQLPTAAVHVAPANTTVAVGTYAEAPTTTPPGNTPTVMEVIGDTAPTLTVPGNDSVPLRALAVTDDGWEIIAGSAPGTPLVFEPPRETPVAVVQAPPPTVTVAVPEQTTVGETVVLNATLDADAGAVTAYQWDVGETTYTEATPAVTLEEAGTQPVSLTVKTELNTTATETTSLTVTEDTEWPWLEVLTGGLLFVTVVSIVGIRTLSRYRR